MTLVSRGRYAARLAEGPADLAAAQRLRHAAFIAGSAAPPRPGGREADPHDALCRHVLIEPRQGGAPVACFRLLTLSGGGEIGRSYSARFYGLAGLERFAAPMLELGRFCIRPGLRDADVLRLAWAALALLADRAGAGLLFGCSSFPGADPARHAEALALLGQRHLAPARWRPGVKAARTVALAGLAGPADPRRALAGLPPLLRSYLGMGGWVSDHAVPDPDLDTLHVFTGLEIAAIPAARARALRALAGAGGGDGRALAR